LFGGCELELAGAAVLDVVVEGGEIGGGDFGGGLGAATPAAEALEDAAGFGAEGAGLAALDVEGARDSRRLRRLWRTLDSRGLIGREVSWGEKV
jgi:hypothetical protein